MPRLTLSIGLRYEIELPTTERFNRTARGFDFTTPSPIQADAKKAYAAKPDQALAPADFSYAPVSLISCPTCWDRSIPVTVTVFLPRVSL